MEPRSPCATKGSWKLTIILWILLRFGVINILIREEFDKPAVEAEVDEAGDLAKLLEELLDDDDVLPAGGQVPGLQQDLVAEGLLV